MNSVSIDVTQAEDHAVVTVSGELDLDTAPQLASAAIDALHDRGVQVLIIDLAGVTFIDSTALGALVRVNNAATAAKIELRLQAVSPRVAQLLKITGMDSAFAIYPAP